MKSAIGAFAALIGGWCWFLTSIAWAATPISFGPNGDRAGSPGV